VARFRRAARQSSRNLPGVRTFEKQAGPETPTQAPQGRREKGDVAGVIGNPAPLSVLAKRASRPLLQIELKVPALTGFETPLIHPTMTAHNRSASRIDSLLVT
jgi:hypothetical protein